MSFGEIMYGFILPILFAIGLLTLFTIWGIFEVRNGIKNSKALDENHKQIIRIADTIIDRLKENKDE